MQQRIPIEPKDILLRLNSIFACKNISSISSRKIGWPVISQCVFMYFLFLCVFDSVRLPRSAYKLTERKFISLKLFNFLRAC